LRRALHNKSNDEKEASLTGDSESNWEEAGIKRRVHLFESRKKGLVRGMFLQPGVESKRGDGKRLKAKAPCHRESGHSLTRSWQRRQDGKGVKARHKTILGLTNLSTWLL